MKIGDLARATGSTVEAVRHYEREGLIAPAQRSAGNYRVYGGEAVERLHFIRRCRSLDMTLPEVRELLAARDAPGGSCAAVNTVLDAHLGHVAQRLAELRQLQRQLLALRARCAQPATAADCGILQELAVQDGAVPPTDAAGPPSHVPGTHTRRRSRPPR
jgi:Cd(II)/Pb(II)-responsive transcriptional regulator